MTHQVLIFFTLRAPRASSRVASASTSSVSMSRWTRLGWSTLLHEDDGLVGAVLERGVGALGLLDRPAEGGAPEGGGGVEVGVLAVDPEGDEAALVHGGELGKDRGAPHADQAPPPSRRGAGRGPQVAGTRPQQRGPRVAGDARPRAQMDARRRWHGPC
jgi:hypothetical protein